MAILRYGWRFDKSSLCFMAIGLAALTIGATAHVVGYVTPFIMQEPGAEPQPHTHVPVATDRERIVNIEVRIMYIEESIKRIEKKFDLYATEQTGYTHDVERYMLIVLAGLLIGDKGLEIRRKRRTGV